MQSICFFDPYDHYTDYVAVYVIFRNTIATEYPILFTGALLIKDLLFFSCRYNPNIADQNK